MIAAGSRATVPDAIRDCGVDYHTSDTIMRIGELPKHLVIVGGGFVAAEFAHTFSALGARVSVVIRGGTLLRHCDDTVCERFTDIASKKWEIHNHCNVVGASQDADGITLTMDNGATLQADTRAGGDRPDPQRRPARRGVGGSRGARRPRRRSTSTNAPLRAAFSHSAT